MKQNERRICRRPEHSRRKRPRCLWRAIVTAALCTGLVFGACGCSAKPHGSGRTDMNYPYEPDTPAPAPHEGVFVSDHGTMTFNGDGVSVLLDFDEDLARRLGLPAGDQTAAYEFRSGNLPPHGYVDVRYDAAMTFWLTVGRGDAAVTVMIDVGQYKDGHFYTGTNCVTSDRITFFVEKTDGSGDWEPVDFLKS